MRFIADFHIHSHFSLATSRNLTPEYLDHWAQIKGIDVVGTGDCTHPGWLAELKEKLEPAGNGLYKLKNSYKLKTADAYLPEKVRRDVCFILTGEISSIYKKKNKVRKVHNVCVLPSFDAARKLQEELSKRGNIASDGRPILGLDAKNVLEIVLKTSDKSFLIPAHIWTPWFSVLGDKSGFDNLEECYEDLTKHIFAVETGLSSDPPMNRVCSFLDPFRLVSNSDAHSPEKLGREANIFDTVIGYAPILDSLRSGKGFLGTVEFFPQEGKYHYDGHRKCNVCWTPLETVGHNGICTVCGKPVTKGVMYRVAELADRKNVFDAPDKNEFYSITSLPDLLSEISGSKPGTKKTRQLYFSVLDKAGPDFHTLLWAPLDDIRKNCGELLAEGIRRMRCGEVHLEEGYDGEFGHVTVFNKDEIEGLAHKSFLAEEKQQYCTTPRAKNSVKFDIDAFKKVSQKLPQKAAAGENAEKKTGEQKQAITCGEGVCMVIAGPGSGKTHVLTERIAYLLQKKKAPQGSILAVTFSNKAAEEIRGRLWAKISPQELAVSTFHAFGLSVLKKHYAAFGRTEAPLIVDEAEKVTLMQNTCPARELKKRLKDISAYKQGIYRSTDAPPFIQHYNELLQKRNAFDLDDLLFLPVKLFRERKDILESYRQQYKWILIDEFQDINPVQYELVRLLAGEGNPNLFVIGDPDQAIYGFRGSDVRFIEALQKDYPEANVIQLSKSYRCPSVVLKLAGQVLGRDKIIEGKPLDIKAEILECETDKSEADLIASKIEEMIGGVRSFSRDSGVSDGTEYKGIESFSDFAVLCRTSAMFPLLLEALDKHGVPVQVLGTDTFLRNEPFASMLGKLKSGMPHITGPVHEALARICESAGITEEDRKRFINTGRPFGSDYNSFFNHIVLKSGADDMDITREAVRLMTLHASKGLEFQAVFIPGCEEGMIPFELFGKKTEEELEEEKRLLYVGATRTKKYLFLTHAKKRLFKGRLLEQQKSSLLEKLQKDLLNQSSRKPKKRDNQLKFSFE